MREGGAVREGGGAQRDGKLAQAQGKAADTTGFPPLLAKVITPGGEVAMAARGVEAVRHADANAGSEDSVVMEPVPTAAAILKGMETAPSSPAAALREIARVQVRGVVHVLYEMAQ